jgi:hypothetical protein
MKVFFSSFFLTIVLFICVNAQTDYRQEITKWRSDHESELKGENSWFSVAGLFWLKEGLNTIGRGEKFDVQLTENFKGEKFGEIIFQNGTATLRVEKGVAARANGQSVAEIPLVSDEAQKQTIIETGSQSFYLIKRSDRYGIRLKDKNSPGRLNF